MEMQNNKILYDDLYKETYSEIFRFCARKINDRESAQDITSEVFLTLYLKWGLLSQMTINQYRIWLFRTANLTVKRFLRNKGYRQKHETYFKEDMIECEHGFIDFEERKQYENYIDEIKKHLSERDYELFRYIVIEELPYEIISKKLGITENTLRVRIMRMRTKLRSIVEKLILLGCIILFFC